MSKYRLIVKKFGDVTDDEICSVDPAWSLGDVIGFANSHNSGTFDAIKFIWFGYKDSYCFVPENAPALVWIED